MARHHRLCLTIHFSSRPTSTRRALEPTRTTKGSVDRFEYSHDGLTERRSAASWTVTNCVGLADVVTCGVSVGALASERIHDAGTVIVASAGKERAIVRRAVVRGELFTHGIPVEPVEERRKGEQLTR